jgi:hypothetical protein
MKVVRSPLAGVILVSTLTLAPKTMLGLNSVASTIPLAVQDGYRDDCRYRGHEGELGFRAGILSSDARHGRSSAAS